MIKFVGKFTAETLFKVETGGKISADGIEFDGADVQRIVDADTGGGVSMRKSKFSGRFGEVGSARNEAFVDISGTTIKNIAHQISNVEPEVLASRLSEMLGEKINAEKAIQIAHIFDAAEKSSTVEERAKKIGIWDWVQRVGGVLGIAKIIGSVIS